MKFLRRTIDENGLATHRLYSTLDANGMSDTARETLAEYAHDAWSGWMKYLFEKSTKNADGTVTIPQWAVERWERQMNTPYSELPETEKASDRKEADEMLAIMADTR